MVSIAVRHYCINRLILYLGLGGKLVGNFVANVEVATKQPGFLPLRIH